MTKKERRARGIDSLPETLIDAVKHLEKDELIMDFLGEETAEKYIEAKKAEWKSYKVAVSEWEVNQYLSTY